jgi:hypothetical protein
VSFPAKHIAASAFLKGSLAPDGQKHSGLREDGLDILLLL